MIAISYFMIGLVVSIACSLIFFGPLKKDREGRWFTSSEVVILVMAVSTLISTYYTIGSFLQAIHYIQYPPPYWIEDPPTFIFGLYFTLTFLPLILTTMLLLVVYLRQTRSLQSVTLDNASHTQGS